MQVCPICGHVNAGQEVRNCTQCWARLGRVAPVRPEEGAVLARLFQLRLLRRRLVRWGVLLAAAIGFTVWGVLVFFEVGPNPPRPTTDINTEVGPGTWAQAGQNPQNTGFTPESAPRPGSVKWTFETSSALSGAPAIAGGRVYLAANDGRTVALDSESGQVLWEYRSGLPAGSGAMPAVTEDLIVISLRIGVVVALDRDTGEPVWETDLRPRRASFRSPPVVINGSVYIGAANHDLYVLDATTGAVRWSFETLGWVTHPVAYVDDTVVLTSRDGLIHVLDTNTGRKRFVYDVGFDTRGSAVIGGDLAYVSAFPSAIYAIDRDAITYPFERAFWAWQIQFWHWGIIDDFPFQKGTVWITDVQGDLIGGPAFAHGAVYFAVQQGAVGALEGATGETLWLQELDRKISTPLTVAGDTVLVGTDDGAVIGLEAESGKVLWDFPLGSRITDSPISAGGAIYAVTQNGTLHALAGAK